MFSIHKKYDSTENTYRYPCSLWYYSSFKTEFCEIACIWQRINVIIRNDINIISICFTIFIFFTVLCFSVTDFRRGARREICGYFNVQIWWNSGVRIGSSMPNTDHARVSTGPDDVPCPLEPTRSVLSRHAIGFHIGPHLSAVESTWWRARRRCPEWSCFAPAHVTHTRSRTNGKAVGTL